MSERERLKDMLEEAYQAGFSEGYFCEDNPGEPIEFEEWFENFLKEDN